MVAVELQNILFERGGSEGQPSFRLEVSELRLESPGVWRIVGLSGTGKTTLLRIMTGLEWPARGTVVWTLGDRRLKLSVETPPHQLAAFRAKDISYAFQGGPLLPFLTVAENLAYRLGLAQPGSLWDGLIDEVQRRVHEHFGSFFEIQRNGTGGTLAQLLRMYPYQLSGGMRQRVSVLQSVLPNPNALFLDEPGASLDPETRKHVLDALFEWQARNLSLLVFVTHGWGDPTPLGARELGTQTADGQTRTWIVKEGAASIAPHGKATS